MDNYKITHDTWNKVAYLYQEKFMDLDLYNDTYNIFCELIPKKDADILEIGCGPGNITKYLVAARPGFRIMANDVAPNMIDLAKINNPTVEFEIIDCRNMDSINRRFDGIVCGFCMPYLSKEDNHKLIKDCSQLLRSRGVLYFSTIKGIIANQDLKQEVPATGHMCISTVKEILKMYLLKTVLTFCN